jgi:hypothetical protein
MANVKVVQKANEEPVATEIIAQAIVKISDATTKLLSSGLTRRAVLILLSAASGVPQTTCKRVLEGLEDMGRQYLVPKSGRKL